MAVTAQTRAAIRDDLILRITQAKPSSDFEVPDSQIDRFIDTARDDFLAGLLFETGKNNGHFVNATYIAEETELALTSVTNSSDLKATIVQPILNIEPEDYGLLRVRVHAKTGDRYTKVNMVDGFTFDIVNDMEFSAPDASNPIGYRKGQILYFDGLPSTYTSTHDIYAEYVESMVGSDTDYSIAGAHVETITKLAEELLRKELGMMIVDPINDGDMNSLQQRPR